MKTESRFLIVFFIFNILFFTELTKAVEYGSKEVFNKINQFSHSRLDLFQSDGRLNSSLLQKVGIRVEAITSLKNKKNIRLSTIIGGQERIKQYYSIPNSKISQTQALYMHREFKKTGRENLKRQEFGVIEMNKGKMLGIMECKFSNNCVSINLEQCKKHFNSRKSPIGRLLKNRNGLRTDDSNFSSSKFSAREVESCVLGINTFSKSIEEIEKGNIYRKSGKTALLKEARTKGFKISKKMFDLKSKFKLENVFNLLKKTHFYSSSCEKLLGHKFFEKKQLEQQQCGTAITDYRACPKLDKYNRAGHRDSTVK